MLETIARTMGCLILLYGALRFVQSVLDDRSARRSAQMDRDLLERWRVADPARYAAEMDWRRNLELKRNGLPTDPGFDADAQRMVASMNDALKESADYQHRR